MLTMSPTEQLEARAARAKAGRGAIDSSATIINHHLTSLPIINPRIINHHYH